MSLFHPPALGGLLALLLLVVGRSSAGAEHLAPRAPTPPAPACTHYAAPQGSGSACTVSAPCTVQTFVTTLATPGRVLCLTDGLYTGSASRLETPASFAGTAEQPIWLRAEHDGQVRIDGEHSGLPLRVQGRYGVVWGVNVTRGGQGPNVSVVGDHWVIKRVVSWDVGAPGTGPNFDIKGLHNLVEDCAAFGRAEKQFEAGSATDAVTGNVLRRVWAAWTDPGDSREPTNAMEQGYGQGGVVMENVIATRGRTHGTSAQAYGVLQTFRSPQSAILGSIFYVRQQDALDSSEVFFGMTDGGSKAGCNVSVNNRYEHNLAYVEPGHPQFATLRAWRLEYGKPCPHGSNNVVRHNVGVSGLPMTCPAPDYTCTNNQEGVTLAAALGGAGHSVWTDSVAAPGLCTRYHNGAPTTLPLWPWPMNARIVEAMAQAGQTPVDVTAEMERLFGVIPDACRWDRQPPDPPDPPPLTSLQCTGDLLAGGRIALECLPHTRQR